MSAASQVVRQIQMQNVFKKYRDSAMIFWCPLAQFLQWISHDQARTVQLSLIWINRMSDKLCLSPAQRDSGQRVSSCAGVGEAADSRESVRTVQLTSPHVSHLIHILLTQRMGQIVWSCLGLSLVPSWSCWLEVTQLHWMTQAQGVGEKKDGRGGRR